ncbi:MAG: hypothetical protein MPN21_00780 [Thermoanaerobaculia bacterium]|nr:hypothetical protein [Thermoanaerobaculia bacterium]
MKRADDPPVAILHRLSEQAAVAHDRLHATVPAGDEPAGVGDLWVLDTPSSVDAGKLGAAVEWLQVDVETNGGDVTAVCLVPVDGSPLLGSPDLAMGDGRVLRCALATWLRPSVLLGAHRSARLDAGDLEAARNWCESLDNGTSEVSPDALETDRDPEYREWIAEIDQTRAAIRQAHGRSELPGAVVADAPEAARRAVPYWAALAAAAVVASLTAVIAGQALHIAKLRQAASQPVIAPAVVWLATGEERATGTQTVASSAAHVLLLLDPGDLPAAGQRYRLEVLPVGADIPLWSGELQNGDQPELFVLLRGSLLSPGEYRLLLTALEVPEATTSEYSLRVSAD